MSTSQRFLLTPLILPLMMDGFTAQDLWNGNYELHPEMLRGRNWSLEHLRRMKSSRWAELTWAHWTAHGRKTYSPGSCAIYKKVWLLTQCFSNLLANVQNSDHRPCEWQWFPPLPPNPHVELWASWLVTGYFVGKLCFRWRCAQQHETQTRC